MQGMGRWLRVVPDVTSTTRMLRGLPSFQSNGIVCFGGRKGSMAGLPFLPSCAPASLPRACSTYNSTAHLIPTISATINCTGDIADGMIEALMCFGASSVSIENGEPSEQENLSGPAVWTNERQQFWKEDEGCDDMRVLTYLWIIRLIALFPPGHDVQKCLALVFNSVGLEKMFPYKLGEVEHQNWEQQVKDLFQPLKVSESLWIIPQWSSPPDPLVVNVILEPGLAFGTGDHPTTQLCLRWLNDVVQGGETILDYGTGSGILAITALKLGASQAVGVDVDPIAIRSATHNGSLNGYGPDLLRLFTASGSGNEFNPTINAKYDIVVANILLNPLLLLSECLLAYTKPGGRICLSGILESQVDQLQETYGLHLCNINVQIQDGWACLNGVKS